MSTATHKYKLKIGEHTFKGECEYSNAGLVAFEETSTEKMSERHYKAVRSILDLLGPLPDEYSDLVLFKVSPIGEEE